MARGGGCSPLVIALRAAERRYLKALVRKQTAQHRQVVRARIVLEAAAGLANQVIARRLGVAVNTVTKWRKRFCQEGFAGLADRKRPGRPPGVPSGGRDDRRGGRLRAARYPGRAREPLEPGRATRRTGRLRRGDPDLDHDAVALAGRGPHQALAASLVDLPARPRLCRQGRSGARLVSAPLRGAALSADEYVISADEKTSIQARHRCHPTLPPGAARALRVEHEYDRGGALAYLAAWDVHRARLFGRCEPSTGIGPFGRLVTQVMTAERMRPPSGCFGSSTTAAPWLRRYGVTTGQAVGPVVVQLTLPWMVGLIGDWAVTWSATTWSMMSRVVARLEKIG